MLGLSPSIASAGYAIDNPPPWESSGDDPLGRVRYDGQCDFATCSWFIRLEVYVDGSWKNFRRTDNSGSAHNRSLYTTRPGKYCPFSNKLGQAHGVTASYRTEFNMKITSQVNHTISADAGAKGSIKVVEIHGNASGEYDIAAFQTRYLWDRSSSKRITCD